MIVLAEALKIYTGLQALDLSSLMDNDSMAAPDGAAALSQAVGVNSMLQHLSLGLNQIGFEGCIALAEAPQVNAYLQSLDLMSGVSLDNGYYGDSRTAMAKNAFAMAKALSEKSELNAAASEP